MSLGKVGVLLLAVALGALGIGAALADNRELGQGSSIALVDDVRKNEIDDELVADDDDGPAGGPDGDDTNGNDLTNGGNDTGADGDDTGGNDRTGGGDNTGDGDGTGGNDGTNGGDNTGGGGFGAGGGGGGGDTGGDTGGGDT